MIRDFDDNEYWTSVRWSDESEDKDNGLQMVSTDYAVCEPQWGLVHAPYKKLLDLSEMGEWRDMWKSPH
jgi:hypothetical protein